MNDQRLSRSAAAVPSPPVGIVVGLLTLDLAIWSFVLLQAANFAS